jgi:hypothetical protein
MSLDGATPKVGSTTYVEPSDGTATSLTLLAGSLSEANIVFDDDTEYLTQKRLFVKVKEPRVQSNAPNGYTQGRYHVELHVPLELDNGSRTVNKLTMELSCDIETSIAERLEMIMLGSQLLGDSDYLSFWTTGSLG